MNTLKDLELGGKTVFLRVDFNVPLDDKGEIRDDTRIRAALPTIEYCLNRKSKLVIASHLGRPKGQFKPELSLKPVAKRLSQLIGLAVQLAPDVVGPEVDTMKSKLKPGQVLILENVRFYGEETADDDDFARKLASGIDIFVNDAFGACHRAHASVVGITRHVVPRAIGFLVEKELSFLKKVLHDSDKPLVAILGGAKVSDKIPVIRSLLDKADFILIGGAMAYTFFAAQGFGVGRSLVEEDMKETALDLLESADAKSVKLYLPLDHKISSSPDSPSAEIVDRFPLPDEMMALDIGPKTVELYRTLIDKARTIFWNGPMGVFEKEPFSKGTTAIAQAVSLSKALSIAGGGDSVAAIEKSGVSRDISHISTGGGASLEFIAKGTLPGIEALT